ncbi:hypothetical protein TWF481_010729 [Arthrobotrys musiformis]|uniref:Uncharacterized protein n=1 Tax=Arthrobotrys musiformis TaxID=47236 RepID=A0AAV9W3G8_9PEZI
MGGGMDDTEQGIMAKRRGLHGRSEGPGAAPVRYAPVDDRVMISWVRLSSPSSSYNSLPAFSCLLLLHAYRSDSMTVVDSSLHKSGSTIESRILTLPLTLTVSEQDQQVTGRGLHRREEKCRRDEK